MGIGIGVGVGIGIGVVADGVWIAGRGYCQGQGWWRMKRDELKWRLEWWRWWW